MLKKRELALLAELEVPSTIADLADRLDWTQSSVSEIASALDRTGLVETHREGRRKIIEPSRSEAASRYRELIRRHPHVDFPDLLRGKAIEVLFYLDDPVTVSELAERTGNYRNTVHRIVTRFQERGIVRKDAGTYVLNDGFRELSAFARAVVADEHRRRVPVAAATILWASPDEFLLLTEDPIDDEAFMETGPRRFAAFDLPLLVTDRWHYFYSDRRDSLSPADVVCHTLLVDDSTRYKEYCLLLLAREPVARTELLDRAARYGVTGVVEALLEYLDTRGESGDDDLPEWSQLERLADEYGVAV